MTTAPTSPPIVDAAAVRAHVARGFGWKEGRARFIRYLWMLPPDWVIAAGLPEGLPGGLEALCGAGDRGGLFTAVLGVVRGRTDSPERLAAAGGKPGSRITAFVGPSGPAAERLTLEAGSIDVTAVHAVDAGGEPHRFIVSVSTEAEAALRLSETPTLMRTIAAALVVEERLQDLLPARIHV